MEYDVGELRKLLLGIPDHYEDFVTWAVVASEEEGVVEEVARYLLEAESPRTDETILFILDLIGGNVEGVED